MSATKPPIVTCKDDLPLPTCKNGLPGHDSALHETSILESAPGHDNGKLDGQNTDRSSGQISTQGPICDDSPTNAPASCSNLEAPVNGSRGIGWRETLPSGHSNIVVCQTGLTPDNHGKNTCINGVLTSAKCLPSPCVDVTNPSNGRRDSNWKELLPSGETNQIACNEGYEPTNGGKNVCTMGVLNTAMCMRKPNWVFREMERCTFPNNGSEVAIPMSTTEDANQMVKDCKANCIARQCNIAAIAPSNRMCYLRFAPVNSSTPVDEQIVCLPQNDQSSWLLANKTYPTSLSCTTITPPKNGRNGPDCTAQLKHGEKCSQSCNNGLFPLIDNSEGVCDNGVFTPITCISALEKFISLRNARTHFGNLATTAPETVVHAVMDVKVHAPVYVRSDNPHSKKQWGCQIPGTDARSSTNDRKSVEALCTENAQCLGYYDGGPWFIATDTDPVKCTNRGEEVYPHFYKKMTHEQRYPKENKVTLPLTLPITPIEAIRRAFSKHV